MTHKYRLLTLVLALGTMIFSASVAWSQDRKVTWQDAPPIAHKMYLTLDEVRSLFTDEEVPYVQHCPNPRVGLVKAKQKLGTPHVRGNWKLVPKTKAVDRTFRNNWNGGYANPTLFYVSTVFRYAPPMSEEKAKRQLPGRPPMSRVDFSITTSANDYLAQSSQIEKFHNHDAARYNKMVHGEHNYYRYTYERDMGLGPERNDMFCYINTSGRSCQVEIVLASERHYAQVRITLIMHGEAMSQERSFEIARGVAVLMCNKLWGMNLPPPGVKSGTVGISDVWLTSAPGATPEEDRHANRVKLGKKVYLAIVFRPPASENFARINVWLRPGQDAVSNSIERTRTRKVDDTYREPLDATDVHGDPEAIQFRPDGKFGGFEVTIKKLSNGSNVAYVPIDTNDYDCFVRGPGGWQVEVEMEEVLERNPAGDDKVRQLSTAKTNLEVIDNPKISREYYDLPDEN